MKNFTVLLLVLLFLLKGQAQQLRIETYQEEQGLPSNFTKAVAQDTHGFIWIGGDQGLWRLDGKHFKLFNFQSLPNIKSLFTRKNGQLLVVHDNGISEISMVQDSIQFKPILISDKTRSDKSLIYPKTVFEDSHNVLWISEPNAIVRYKDKKLKRYPFANKYSTTSFLRSFIFAENKPGNLIVASQQGFLFYYNTEKDVFSEIQMPQKSDFISALLPINEAKIWMGASDGIKQITLNGQNEVTALTSVSNNLSNISCFQRLNTNEIFAGTWNSGLFVVNVSQKDPHISKVDLHFKTINALALNEKNQCLISSDDGIALVYKTSFSKIHLSTTRTFIQSLILGEAGASYCSDGSTLFKLSKLKDSIIPDLLVQAQKEDFLSLAVDNGFLYVGTNTGKVYQMKDKIVLKTLNVGSNADGSSIFFLHADPQHNIWVCHDFSDIIQIDAHLKVKHYAKDKGILSNIFVIKSDAKGNIYCGGKGKSTYLYKYNQNKDQFDNISIFSNVLQDENFAVNDLCADANGLVWLGTNRGLFIYDGKQLKKQSLINPLDNYEIEVINGITAAADSGFWLGTNIGLVKYYDTKKFLIYDKLSGLPSKTIIFRNIVFDKNLGLLCGTTNGLGYSTLKFREDTTPQPVFLSLNVNAKKIHFREDSVYTFKDNSFFEAEMTALSYPSDKITLKYRLLGRNETWSLPSLSALITLPQLRVGAYTLEVAALNQGGFYWSKPVQFKFKIEQSVYFTWWAICIYLILFSASVYIIVKLYTAHLVREKNNLENIVLARTAEINGQKEEILVQKEEIMQQKDTLEEKSNKLALAYQDIQDSIHYAKTIQEAMLQSKTVLDAYLKDHFILFRPRDVVSGDFYWFAEKEGKIIIAAIDCTGHGVPGALMSMVGNTVMNQVINEKGILASDQILTGLNAGIRVALKQDETSSRDGMDVALCVIDKLNNTVEYSGAHNPLYYIQDNILHTIKADPHSIGGGDKKTTSSFKKHIVDISIPTMLYLFSDGFQDQIGGPEKIKFMRKPFQDLLFSMHNQPMETQKEVLENTINNWIGKADQMDDILIIGVRI